MGGSGISWTICKSFAPHSRQPRQYPITQFFTGRMLFLTPNQQCQSTEGNACEITCVARCCYSSHLVYSFSQSLDFIFSADVRVRIRIQILSESDNFWQIRNITNLQNRFSWIWICHMAAVRHNFDFQHGVSYQCSVVSIALKCTTVELEAWDRQTERQTDGWTAALLIASPTAGGALASCTCAWDRLPCSSPTRTPRSPRTTCIRWASFFVWMKTIVCSRNVRFINADKHQ